MTVSARAPTVLIAEPDRSTSDLLARLVRTVCGDARVLAVRDGHGVLERCRADPPDLLIADCDLPGVGGLELLREVRQQRGRPGLPFFLTARRVDAGNVRAAVALAPTAYLTKPFDNDDLSKRLRQVLAGAPPRPLPALADYLAQNREQAAGAPALAEVAERLRACLGEAPTDLVELERALRDDPQLTARLIAVANSAERQRSSPCQTLAQALARLGIRHSLNLALGLALQRGARLDASPLLAPADTLWRLSLRTADVAHWLAQRLEADAERCYTAGLLHRLGDLALLRTLQAWCSAGGELQADQVESALEAHAAGYGGALRTRWRLPVELRQLIGAAYGLHGGVYSREALILHLAAQIAHWPDDTPLDGLLEHKAARLLRLRAALLADLPRAARVA